jgi:hypothetical protein
MKASAVTLRHVRGGVQVATWFGASELGWKMTQVVTRHRTLLRPRERGARWGNSHT